jgi:SAM-dependent methyltransferase
VNTNLGTAVLTLLTRFAGPAHADYEDNDPYTTSKLSRLFGADVRDRLLGKVVVDFGSGRGADAVNAALNGAARVVGVEIRPQYLEKSRALAQAHHVSDRCSFLSPIDESADYSAMYGQCDYVVTLDTFEHFSDPAAAFEEMYHLLKPGGSLLISFGPPWMHPYGAHMRHFNKFPWLHVLFREKDVLAVENAGATRYEETISGPNRMTVRRFEQLARSTRFRCVQLRRTPVWGLSWLAKGPTREYFTSIIDCEMIKP